MQFAAIAATVISASATAYSAYSQGQAADDAARANARNAELEGANRQQEGAEARTRERTRNFRRISTLRVQLARQGTLSETGTPLAILGEHTANLELGIQDAARSADIQSRSLQSQADMMRWQGQQAASAGTLDAFATGFSGLDKTAGTYTQGVYQKLYPDRFNLFRTKTLS
jgi:hypothetical protein